MDSAIHYAHAALSYDLKIERQLAPATSLTIGYDGSHSYHQILNGDLNEPAYTIAANGQVFYPAAGTPTAPAAPIKANPAVANTTSWWSGASGNYNALVVDLRHSFDHGLQLRGNYTWSKNLDDGSAWNTSVSSNTPAFVEVPSLPHLDYGPAATDIRNVASINATYELPFGQNKAFFGNAGNLTDHIVSGWSVAPPSPRCSQASRSARSWAITPPAPVTRATLSVPTWRLDSLAPCTPAAAPPSASPSSSTPLPSPLRPPVMSAMPAATHSWVPGFADWDFSLLKSTALSEHTRLQFRAEFFNIINHTNLQLPNEVVYSASPTQGTTANQTHGRRARLSRSHLRYSQHQPPDPTRPQAPLLELVRHSRGSRWSALKSAATIGSTNAKPNTRHEVAAPRAVGPSGRTHFSC